MLLEGMMRQGFTPCFVASDYFTAEAKQLCHRVAQ